MARFGKMELTQKGRKLLNKVITREKRLEISRVAIGNGEFSGDVQGLTDMVSFVLNGRIIKSAGESDGWGIEIIFTNENISEDFEFREIGVFAIDPDDGEVLYSYTNSGKNFDYISCYDGDNLEEERVNIKIYTAGTSNVYAEITKSETASQIEYDDSVSEIGGDNVQTVIEKITEMISEVDTEAKNKDGGNADTVDGKHATDLQNYNNLTNKPTSLKNPYSLTIKGNGTTLTNGIYDGSASKTVNITPSSIGAAVSKTLSGIDFDNVTVPGLYMMLSNINAPVSSAGLWSLIVLNYGSPIDSYTHQMAIHGNTTDFYIRCLYGGSWSDWRKVNDSGNADTVDGKHASDLQNYNNLTNKPTSLKNPYSLTIQGNGTTLTNGTYDGSVSKTVNITPSSIGAAVGKAVSSDFNTIKTQGLYCVSSSVNAPMNYTYWSLIVLNSTSIGGNYVQQIAFKEGTTDGYMRCYKSGVWSKWKKYGDNKYFGYDCVIASFDSSDEDKLLSDFICPEDNARQLLFEIMNSYGYKKIIFLNGTYNIKIDTETITSAILYNHMHASVGYPVGLRPHNGQKLYFADKVVLNFQTTKQFANKVIILDMPNAEEDITVFNNSDNLVTINITDNYGQTNMIMLSSLSTTVSSSWHRNYVNNLKINITLSTSTVAMRFFQCYNTELNNIIFNDVFTCETTDNVYSFWGESCGVRKVFGKNMNGQHIQLWGNCNVFECDSCKIDITGSYKGNIVKYNRNCTITNSSTYTNIVSDNV